MKDNLIKILALVAFSTLAVAIYYSNERIEQKKALQKANNELQAAKDSIKFKNQELEILRDKVSKYNDSLINLLNESNKMQESRVQNIIQKADNSKYLITMHSLKPDKKIQKKIIYALNYEGYSAIKGMDIDRRTNWISTKSTVLYYTEASQKKAEQIASIISKATGVEFETKRGAGLGVGKGEESWTFFIHYVNE